MNGWQAGEARLVIGYVVCNAKRTLKKKIRNITFLILGLTVLYVVSAMLFSNYISDRYDYEMNEKRVELGLMPIGNNWSLDSVEFIDYGNYSINERKNISDWYLKFENEKLYCQHWSINPTDTTLPYHKTKKIFYFQSFWLWKNKILWEFDIYINPKTNLEYEELLVSYYYTDNDWFSRLDTLETELKKQQDKTRIASIVDYAKKNDLYLCGTALAELERWNDFYIDTVGLKVAQADDILKKWEIK